MAGWPSARPTVQFVLDLARDDVPDGGALRSGLAARWPRSCTWKCWRPVYQRLRVPLPAPCAGRPPLRHADRDVRCAGRRCGRHRHPPDPAAGAVRPAASTDARWRTPEALRARRRWLPAPVRGAVRAAAGCRVGCALQPARGAGSGDARGAGRTAARRAIHIHVAEQIGEVRTAWRCATCARWNGCCATPRSMRAGPGPRHPPQRWRVRDIARSGATVAICPTTEANLGDGLFRLRDYLDAGGAWGIGSDSHVSVSPVEELRWLEYGQRLATRRRNIAVAPDSPGVHHPAARVLASRARDRVRPARRRPGGAGSQGARAGRRAGRRRGRALDLRRQRAAGARGAWAGGRWWWTGCIRGATDRARYAATMQSLLQE